MTKKPATPLPWVYGQSQTGKLHYVSASIRNVIDMGSVKGPDAAYIVEACNAYPNLLEDRRKLVEALRGSNVWLKAALDYKEWRWDSDQREAAQSSHDDAAALLRELGELI